LNLLSNAINFTKTAATDLNRNDGDDIIDDDEDGRILRDDNDCGVLDDNSDIEEVDD
jgi:hypothetical protein